MSTMTLKNLISEIDNFSAVQTTSEIEIVNFFEDIEEQVNGLRFDAENEKRELITTLFNYLNNQSPDLEENWNFIHLIEDLDKPDYNIYTEILIEQNRKNPTNTSVLLLNRYLNSLKTEELSKYMEVFDEILRNVNISAMLKEDAKGYFDYQKKKVEE